VNASIHKLVILTHGWPDVSASALEQALAILTSRGVQVLALPNEWEKHGPMLAASENARKVNGPSEAAGAQLCLVLGGDGSMLRAFRLAREIGIPVAGVNLGRVGVLATVQPADLLPGLERLLDGDFIRHPLIGLQADLSDQVLVAGNDVVVSKGERSRVAALSLEIDNIKLFDALCDGMVAATPIGSSAYNLAAGGPLLGVDAECYAISLIAPHLVGVRSVVAGPGDVLRVTNMDDSDEVFVDIDGERLARLEPGLALSVRTCHTKASLALLTGDSLYRHFRDRLV
jgi:NAD+ kinase